MKLSAKKSGNIANFFLDVGEYPQWKRERVRKSGNKWQLYLDKLKPQLDLLCKCYVILVSIGLDVLDQRRLALVGKKITPMAFLC